MIMKTFHTIYNNFAKRNLASLRLLLVMLLTLTVSVEVWAETATYTLNSTNNGGSITTGDVSWSIASGAITVQSNNCKLAGTITVTLPAGATLNKVSIAKSNTWGSGASVTFQTGTTTLYTFSTSGEFALTTNKDKLTYTFSKSGSSSKNAWVKSITVDYTAAPSCSVKPTVGTTLQSVTATENSIKATIPISSIGGCNITENGLVYSTTNSTPTVGGSGCTKVTTTACGSTAANKTVTITGLNCGTSYYIRGYATNEAGTSYTDVTTQSTSDCPKYTITLKDDNSTLTQSTAGGSVTLPSRDGCVGYTFVGWTNTWKAAQTTWTTTAPTIIPAGSYTPTANENLYPVYTKTEGGGTAYEKVTTLTEGVYVMVSEKTSGTYKYMPNTTSSDSNPTLGSGITMNNGKTSLTNDITEAMLWDLTATGTANQYYLRPHGSTTIGLGCTTSTGANIRISSSYKDVKWTITTSTNYEWQFMSNATNPMYLAVYSDDNWRNYTSATTNQNGKFYLFKQTSSSITSYISVPNCCTQLAEVTNFKFSSITSNSITVAVPDDYSDKANASGYTFNCYSASTGGSPVATADENGTSHTFTGLTKNTTYYFTVIAKGEGDYCNSVETSARESSKTLTQYTITLNPNGGTGDFSGWSNYTMAVDAGTQITLPELSKTGYDFAGWNDGATTVTSTYTPTKDITLTAQWTAIEYTITYNDTKGATNSNPTTYTIEDEISFAALTDLPKGYNFTGWNPASIAKGTTGNQTVTAQWTEKPLTRYRTDCDACIPLDGHAEINGTYHFFPGETITLTVTPPADDVPYTYQWQKKVNSDYENIEDETGLTYTKENATTSDVGHYRCVVSSDGYCDAIAEYNVKCLQLYVYYDNKSDVFNTPLNRGAEENTATISVDLQNASYKYYFKITDGCGNWYGNTGTMVRDNCTNWSMNVNEYCGLQTTKFGTYVFNVNYSDLAHLTVSVIYPAALQEVGKVIYLDNNVLKWNHSDNADGTNKIYYRIGRSHHNNKTAMTLVPGTANLYKVTTGEYDNFDVWHIANNGCGSDDKSIYITKTNDKWAATQATAFETLPVTSAAVTITPTNLRSVGGDDNNSNCEFYNYDITEGMKTGNAKIVEPTNGTITVAYTHHDGTAVSDFTSGNRDLAHTCLLTITATPDAGYKLGTLTVNDVAFTSGNVHTLTENAVIKAEYAKATYTVTFDGNGADGGSTAPVSGEYQAKVTLTPNGFTRMGYTFTGWNTQADGNGDPYEDEETITIPSQDITLYAQWEQAYTITWKVAGVALEGAALGGATIFVNPGDGITDIPTPPADNTLEDCGAIKFMGWSTVNIGSIPQTDAPCDLFTTSEQAQELTIDGNKTFYAVFASAEGEDIDYSNVHTSNATISEGSRCTASKVIIDEQEYDAMKAGTSSYNGSIKITVPAGTTNLYFKMAGWNGKGGKTITLSGATADPTTFKTIADAGISGTETEYALEGNIADYSYSVALEGITTQTTLVFSNSAKEQQFVIWGANAASITYSNYVTSCCATPAPTNGTFNNVTGSGNAMSLTLNWEGSAARYHITGGNLAAEGVYTSATSYTVNNLIDCEEYTFNITAYPADGCESASIQISAQPFSGAKSVTFVYGNEQPNTTFTTDCDNQSTALPTPTRSGYRFLGWFTEESGGIEITENPYTPTTDITLHAQWVQVFTVTYNPNNATSGTVPTDANSPYDINTIVTVQDNTGNLQRLGYNFVGWNTAIDASGTPYSAGQTFTITENTTLYAQWIENYCTLTFTIPSGGGQAVSAPEQVLNGYPITFPEVTGISAEYWCETFIGWTTEKPNGEGLWDGTPTIYDSGTNSKAITANTIFYAVYQRSGGGASGTVDLTCEDVSTWKSDVLSESKNAYGTVTTRTATDGSVWTTNGQIADAGDINLKDAYYLKLPELPGSITTIRMKVSQGNCADACSDIAGNETEYKVNFKSTTDGNVLFSSEITTSRSRTIEITDGTYYTGYLYCSSGTLNVHAVSVDYGPAPIISHSLQCGCAIDEFNLTYDANETYFPNSTTNCEGVTGYKFSENEDKYTICSSVPTLDGYKFIGWTTNANGSGDLYTSGQEIKCVPSSDITLYAQYERVYTVIFDNQNTIKATTQTRSGAAVDVPTATEPCGSEWQFVGWSTEEIAPMSLKPTITIEPGINTYIPEGNVTLYAIYQKTSLSKEFVAGKTGAYKISNGNDKYASTFKSSYLQSANNLGDATTYYITYTASDDGKYTIQQADGQYIAYSGDGTSLKRSEEPYYWKITKEGELWQVTTIPAGRYLKYDYEFRAYTEKGNIGLIATEGQYYYRTMSCDDNFDITFNNQKGAIIHWQNGYPQAAYQDLEGGTTITTFPTASYEGWTFIGWRAQEYEESTSAPESSSVYGGRDGISGNALTITANMTMYPVFTQFLDNDPFDAVNGGDYYMYYIADGDIGTSVDEYGATNRIYAGEYTDYSFRSTQSCADATLFTFAKLPNGKWTIYDNKRKKFVYGVNNDNKLEDKAQNADGKIKYVKEWTIEVYKGNQVNAVSVDGYILSAFTQDAKSGTFKNYDDDNLTNGNGDQYHLVYLGTCTERVFTTAPSTEPIITLNGDVKVTSTATQSVKAASVLTVSASNIATSNLSITSDNAAFIVSPTTITVVDKKVGVTPITITYKPTITSDGTETATITVSDGNEASESITVTGRHLPENFVIAAKWGDNWYALPANMDSQSSTEGLLIEVDDAANPTKAIAAPNTTKYGLKSVYTSNSLGDRFANYGERLVFVENVEESTPVANKTLYNGGGSGTSNTNILVYAQYANYSSENAQAPRYEWIPTTTNLQDYTLTSAHQFTKDDATLENARTVSLDNHGEFGTLLQNKAYNGMVRLLPVDNFYGPAELQVVEWKANSVSIMYTGAGTKATTKVGNSESEVQLLSDNKIDHAVYTLSTSDLTSATNQPLTITIKDNAEATIGAITITIPAIVATNNTSTALGVTEENAKATSIVVLDGATLTADAIKYTYDDVTVYPGGKLVIGQSAQLGMYTLTLRAGSSWGAADYEHKYPQFVLNNSATNAYSNSSGQINLDYVTTKEQYYTFVAPFDVKTKDIKYPVDIYGSNVGKANSGSFEFQYYDGEARAAGSPGWKVVEEGAEGATLRAGQGYTFLGMPKKIAGTRQKYGIHRIPMKVAAGIAQSHETADQTVPLSVHLSAKNNNSGWNLVGNPYMSNVANLSNNDIQVGELVHTNDANGNWTGGWHWDNPTTGQRFLVIPSNDGKSYEAVQASNATLPAFKNFFVQISNANANAMSIPVANRVERNLAPARYAEVRPERDVEVAIVIEQDEAHSDQLDFLLNDMYSAAFDFNGDFTKMMNATNLNIYGVHTDDNLSFIAIDQHTAQQSIPIGYQVPAAGEYTLCISNKPYVMWNEIDALYVTDHEISPEVTVDLLHAPYEFSVNQAETNNERFTVSVRVKAKTENGATGLGNVGADGEQIHKFIYQDKMYILHHGVIYDATGKRVITINK